MNILIVHNFYKIPGGEDTVVNNEMQMLKEHGHKVVLYTRSNMELDSLSKLQKLKLPFTTIYNSQTVKDVTKIIKEENIEIVHVHNTLNLVSPSVYYAAEKCKVPVVQTVHNFRLECMGACFYRDDQVCEDCLKYGNKCALKHACYRNSKLQTLACLLSNWYHRKTGIYKRINYICLTDFNKEKLLQWKHKGKAVLKEKQIFIKPNFTYEVQMKTEENKEDYYLFIGRIEKIKGIDKVVDAFTKLQDKKLKVAGTGTEYEAYKNKSYSNIEFLGHQKREEINRLLVNAKALIVASQWYETFGMVVAEAYAAGTPVIAGDIGNIGNIVEDGKTGLKFKYNDSDEIVKTIVKFESMDRDQLSKNALAKYKKEFTMESNYQRLYEIYRNIEG